MARKTLVFFLMLLVGSLTGAGRAQEATRPTSPDVLRWTSPRPQVRPVAGTTSAAYPGTAYPGAPASRPVVTPIGAGVSRVSSPGIQQAAAQAPVVDETGAAETSSVLKRKGAPTPPPPAGMRAGGSPMEEEVPVAVPARRLGGGTPTVPPTTRAAAPGPAASRAPAPTSPKSLALRCPAPALQVEAVGPKSVTVGRSATYTVTVANPTQDAAVGVEVRVAVPEWIEAPTMQAMLGEVSRPAGTDAQPADGTIVWSIPEVAPGARVELMLQLVPRDNRVFELAIDWTQQPPRQAITVAVQQPQLQLSVAGPKDARYGESVSLLITVANPGTGDAENVTVRLSAGNNAPENIPVGLIPAGQQKQIEVQLAASQPGTMAIAAEATADGEIRASSDTELLVRKAELQLALTAPEKAFTGSPVTYVVRVSNSGTAAAEDTVLSVALPVGAKLEASTEGSQSTDQGLVWRIGSLAPGIERVFEIQCEAATAGENRLEAKVAAAGGISQAEVAVTEVQALADLKLSVVEPTGARRVGDEVVYEVTVVNRGSKAAEEINVLVQFSEGIEPIGTDGGTADLAEGQAIFQPLPRLGPGQKAVLKVRAKADRPGNLRYRVQVSSDQSETQLVSEGTTRFFGEAGAATENAARPAEPRAATLPPSGGRTTATAGRPTPARR